MSATGRHAFHLALPVRYLALLLVGALSACAESPLPPLPASERDEAGVYAAVLREYARILELAEDEAARQFLLVGDHTAWWSDPPADGASTESVRVPEFVFEQKPPEFRAVWTGASEDLALPGLAQRAIPRVVIDAPIEWVPRMTSEERRAYLLGGLVETLGSGVYLITLSRIGFDPRGDRALLLVEFSASPMSGWSDLVCLERDEIGWRVVETITYEEA